MPLLDDIQRVLRSFQRYTGDGLPNPPVGHPLSSGGDPRSGIHHLDKADLRDLLVSIAQSLGDPSALQSILTQLDGKAEDADVTAVLRNAGVITLTNVTGEGNAITAEFPAALAPILGTGIPNGLIIGFVSTITSTDSVDLTIGTDTTPLRQEGGQLLNAEITVKTGRFYAFRRHGAQWRMAFGDVALKDVLDQVAFEAAARADAIQAEVVDRTEAIATAIAPVAKQIGRRRGRRVLAEDRRGAALSGYDAEGALVADLSEHTIDSVWGDLPRMMGDRQRRGLGRGIAHRREDGAGLLWLQDDGVYSAWGKLAIASNVAGSSLSLADRDAINKGASAQIKQRVPNGPALSADYIIFLSEGQSFSNGSEARGTLSTATALSCLMLGEQVRSAAPSEAGWTSIGGDVLHPLVEGRQGVTGLDGTVITDDTVAYMGETYISGWLRTLKARMAAQVFADDLPDRRFVGNAMGPGNTTIAQHQKGASQGYYLRGQVCVQKIKAIADGEGRSAIVAAFSWSQGENNASATQADYFAALSQLIADKRADYMATTGQAEPPLVYLTPPGGRYTNDAANLGIQMAFLQAEAEIDGVYLVGPYYQYPSPPAHIMANSYRWHGCQIGKVATITQVHKRGWHSLRPRQVTASGRKITIDFLVPVPPLQWGTAYDQGTVVDFVDKGFRVTGGAAAIGITSVQIVADTIVQIELATAAPEGALLWYGDRTTHNGKGQLCDSDPWRHDHGWEYPADHLDPIENLPSLIGQTYGGENWCAQFCLPITITQEV